MDTPFKPQMANYRNGAKTVAYYEDEVFKPYPQDSRFLISNRGSVYDTKNQVLLEPHDSAGKSADGTKAPRPYKYYHLIGHYGSAAAHRLVMETFHPHLNSASMDVNHIDGCKWHNVWSQDPAINNLEWVTRSQNMRHAYETGLVDPSSRGYTTYTPEQIHAICQLFQQGYSSRQVADILGYSGFNFYRLVSDLRNGKMWRSITSNYNLPPAPIHSKEEVVLICELIMMRLSDDEVAQRMKDDYGYIVKPGFVKSIRYHSATWYNVLKDYTFPKQGKYTKEQIEKICQGIVAGKASTQIANELGIDSSASFKSTISQIRSGKLYRSIASRYDLSPMNKR